MLIVAGHGWRERIARLERDDAGELPAADGLSKNASGVAAKRQIVREAVHLTMPYVETRTGPFPVKVGRIANTAAAVDRVRPRI